MLFVRTMHIQYEQFLYIIYFSYQTRPLFHLPVKYWVGVKKSCTGPLRNKYGFQRWELNIHYISNLFTWLISLLMLGRGTDVGFTLLAYVKILHSLVSRRNMLSFFLRPDKIGKRPYAVCYGANFRHKVSYSWRYTVFFEFFHLLATHVKWGEMRVWGGWWVWMRWHKKDDEADSNKTQ